MVSLMLSIVKLSDTKLYIFRDTLSIYDGDSHTSPILGIPYYGDSLPPSQISSTNHLLIHFQSNQALTATGFKLEYNATSKYPSIKNRELYTLFLKLRKKEIEEIFLGYSLIKICTFQT